MVCIYPNTWISIDKKVNVKLKVFKHSWIGAGIGATHEDNALVRKKIDEKNKNANANGEYNDDHTRVSTLNMKKMIRMRKKKGRQNIKKTLMKKLTTNDLNNVMKGIHQKMFINIIEIKIC